jgi:hypothetical protein
MPWCSILTRSFVSPLVLLRRSSGARRAGRVRADETTWDLTAADEPYSKDPVRRNQTVTWRRNYPASMLVHVQQVRAAPAQRLGYPRCASHPHRETLRSTALTSALATGNTLPAVMRTRFPSSNTSCST